MTDDYPADRLDELIVRHPKLFHGKHPRVYSQCPAGWFDLVDKLCTDLEAILGDATGAFAIEQIKQKWAGLRFYWSIKGTAEPLYADLIGFHPRDEEDLSEQGEPGYRLSIEEKIWGTRISMTPSTELGNAVTVRIESAETESEATCEWCGAPGQLWIAGRGGPGYHYTACAAHKGEHAKSHAEWYAEMERRRDERARKPETGNSS